MHQTTVHTEELGARADNSPPGSYGWCSRCLETQAYYICRLLDERRLLIPKAQGGIHASTVLRNGCINVSVAGDLQCPMLHGQPHPDLSASGATLRSRGRPVQSGGASRNPGRPPCGATSRLPREPPLPPARILPALSPHLTCLIWSLVRASVLPSVLPAGYYRGTVVDAIGD